MSLLDRINEKLKSFIKGEEKKPEDEQCPVCGYYCTGNGGVGCIGKPDMVEEPKPKLKPMVMVEISPPKGKVVDISDTDIAKDLEERLNAIDKQDVIVVGDKSKDISIKQLIKEKRGTKYFNPEVAKEVDELIKEAEIEKCQPDTCHGECQGFGWCDIAQEWQGRIHPDNRVFPAFKKREKRKKYNREHWKEIKNRRKKKKMKHKRKLKKRK